jgi:hypothetical protein
MLQGLWGRIFAGMWGRISSGNFKTKHLQRAEDFLIPATCRVRPNFKTKHLQLPSYSSKPKTCNMRPENQNQKPATCGGLSGA